MLQIYGVSLASDAPITSSIDHGEGDTGHGVSTLQELDMYGGESFVTVQGVKWDFGVWKLAI
jgi:hypothetical protein